MVVVCVAQRAVDGADQGTVGIVGKAGGILLSGTERLAMVMAGH
jgi:hypothetical protein